VEIFTFPGRPEEVCEAGVPIAGLFGAFFFVVGLWPLHTALTSRPTTLLTWLLLASALAYVAYRVRGVMIPKGQRKSAAEWMTEKRAERQAGYAAVPVRRVEDALTAHAASDTRSVDPKKFRFLAPVLVVIGIAAIGLGVNLGRQLAHREAAGVRAPGVVISLADNWDSDGTVYHPVVRFTDATGEPVEFKDRIGSDPPSYHVGEAVTVLYEKDAPAQQAMIDRGGWNWLPSILLGLFGTIFAFAGFRIMGA
jgi:hypothetical protein